MDKKPQYKENHKFLTWISGAIILLVFAIGTTILWYFINLEAIAEGEFLSGLWFIVTFMFLVLPWGLAVYCIKICWSSVTLDNKGISRSLFKVFFKRKIDWQELHEIRIKAVPTGGAWLFFSKQSLEGMSIGKARTRKGTIQVALSLKVLKAVRQFTDKEIINLPNDIAEKLNEKKD